MLAKLLPPEGDFAAALQSLTQAETVGRNGIPPHSGIPPAPQLQETI